MYPGFNEAYEATKRMNEEQLLAQLDSLYGRDNLPEDYTLDQLRYEALQQVKRDFRTPEEQETLDFWLNLHKARSDQFR